MATSSYNPSILDLGMLNMAQIIGNEPPELQKQSIANAIQMGKVRPGDIPALQEQISHYRNSMLAMQQQGQQPQGQGNPKLSSMGLHSQKGLHGQPGIDAYGGPYDIPQMPEQSQGLASLPADFQLRGGGIVAFAGGGEPYQTEFDLSYDEAPAGEAAAGEAAALEAVAPPAAASKAAGWRAAMHEALGAGKIGRTNILPSMSGIRAMSGIRGLAPGIMRAGIIPAAAAMGASDIVHAVAGQVTGDASYQNIPTEDFYKYYSPSETDTREHGFWKDASIRALGTLHRYGTMGVGGPGGMLDTMRHSGETARTPPPAPPKPTIVPPAAPAPISNAPVIQRDYVPAQDSIMTMLKKELEDSGTGGDYASNMTAQAGRDKAMGIPALLEQSNKAQTDYEQQVNDYRRSLAGNKERSFWANMGAAPGGTTGIQAISAGTLGSLETERTGMAAYMDMSAKGSMMRQALINEQIALKKGDSQTATQEARIADSLKRGILTDMVNRQNSIDTNAMRDRTGVRRGVLDNQRMELLKQKIEADVHRSIYAAITKNNPMYPMQRNRLFTKVNDPNTSPKDRATFKAQLDNLDNSMLSQAMANKELQAEISGIRSKGALDSSSIYSEANQAISGEE